MKASVIDPKNQIRNHDRYSTSHHRSEGGYRNPWGPQVPQPPAWKTALWIAGRLFRFPGFDPTPVKPIDPQQLQRTVNRYEVTWLGHATALIRSGRRTILTDPVFSKRIGPVPGIGLSRLHDVPIEIEDLPRVDVVLISHDHYDHLDMPSLLRLEHRFRPRFLVPLGLEAPLRAEGLTRVCEFDWWQFIELEELAFHCLPAKHFSGRGAFDRDRSLWCSWSVADRSIGTHIYFAGDSGYGPHFKEIRAVLGPMDVALIPIGSYMPRWLMKEIHVDPAESLQAFLDLEADRMLGIHWGCFDLADEAVHEPARILPELAALRGLEKNSIHVLPVGGSIRR